MIIRADKFFLWLVSLFFLILYFPVAVISECKAEERKEIILPIIMYHHITTDINKAGKYTVLQSEFENDLKYIKDKGYITITPTQLYEAIIREKPLPDKIIMLTFDDGFESFYKLCFPLLKSHNMNAVLSVIGIQSEKYSNIDDHNINYSNLNWKTIKELSQSGYVEIGNHTFDLHHNEQGERKGMSKLKNEKDYDYEKNILYDITKMQLLLKQRSGVNCKTIAYPYGLFNNITTRIIKEKGLICSLTCEERINIINYTEDLYNLGRYNRCSGISSKKFFEDIFSQAEKLQVDTA